MIPSHKIVFAAGIADLTPIQISNDMKEYGCRLSPGEISTCMSKGYAGSDEKHLAFILGLEEFIPSWFVPKKRNIYDFIKPPVQAKPQNIIDQSQKTIRIINKIGGYTLMSKILGIRVESIKQWLNKVDENGIKGLIPKSYHTKLITHAAHFANGPTKKDFDDLMNFDAQQFFLP